MRDKEKRAATDEEAELEQKQKGDAGRGGRWRKMRSGALGKGRRMERRRNGEEGETQTQKRKKGRRQDRGQTESKQPRQPAASAINNMRPTCDMRSGAPAGLRPWMCYITATHGKILRLPEQDIVLKQEK